MTTRVVYLLSSYGEHGAENVTATLDRGRLPALLAAYGREAGEAETLERALRAYDTDPRVFDCYWDDGTKLGKKLGVDGFNLSAGWGGLQLHIVPLSEAEDG